MGPTKEWTILRSIYVQTINDCTYPGPRKLGIWN
jgi:hypothetical protein